MPTLLSVGADMGLLQTRHLVLRTAFPNVISATPEEAGPLLQNSHFDLLVFCHSLGAEDLLRLCRQTELFWPSSKVLVMGDGVPRCHSDASFPWCLGPRYLLKSLQELLQSADRRQERQSPAVPLQAQPQLSFPPPSLKGIR